MIENKNLDYSKYCMKKKERLFYIATAACVIYFCAFIFYRSHFICLLLIPLSFLYPGMKSAELVSRRRNELNIQFKDMLYSLSSSLSVGRSIESAFRDVLKDLSVQYPSPDTFIVVEVEHIIRKLEMNETMEAILMDFSKRACLDDLDNFVDVFHICRRTGGNIVEVVRNTSGIINDRIEMRQEIDMLLAQRRFEQKVLNLVPLLMIMLLSVSAGEYMKPVFTTAIGKLVMSVSIVLLAVAFLISKKISDIKI